MGKVSMEEMAGFLSQDTPREPTAAMKRMAAKGGCFSLGMGMVLLVFCTPFLLLLFPWRIHHDIRMAASTPETAAGVVTAAPDSNMTVSEVPVYRTEFAFSVDGTEWTGASFSRGRQYAVGQEVVVEYLPEDPHVSRIEGTSLTFGWFGLFVLLFPLFGVGMIVGGIASYRKKSRILRTGTFAAGHVLEVEATNVTVNERRQYRIEIGFTLPDGTEQTTSWKTTNEEDIQVARSRKSSEAVVGVLYDPGSPSDSILVDTLVK